MPDFTVVRYGLDVYGRPVFLTAFMRDWFENYCDALGFRPLIAQGAYMERLGGGAAASEGAHDKAKCLDLRTTDRTTAEIDAMVWEARIRGAGAYRRDQSARHGGMTPHMHLTLGADADGSPMADILWQSYVSGGDGLAGPGSDYERRPNPLVLVPPEEDDMSEDEVRKIVRDEIANYKVDVGGTSKVKLPALLVRLWERTKK